jgi:hypothetical protein
MPRPLPWYPTISSVRRARGDLVDPSCSGDSPCARFGGGLAHEHIRHMSTFLNFDDRFFWAVYLVYDPIRCTQPPNNLDAACQSACQLVLVPR